MSFGFGISDFEYVFSTTLRLRRLFRDLRMIPGADDEMEADISLMVDLLKESVEMLGKTQNPAPASVRAAMVRFTILTEKTLKAPRRLPSMAQVIDLQKFSYKRIADTAQQFSRTLESVLTFHNIVSQFYERTQLDRLIELQISSGPPNPCQPKTMTSTLCHIGTQQVKQNQRYR
jgi:hypothetical protein